MLARALMTLVLMLGFGAATAQPAISGDRFVAIVGVNVLPMTGPDVLRDQTVIISGEKIVRIGPRRSIQVPAGTIQIDGTGLFAMPGLVDMHVHLAPEPGNGGDAAQRALAVMLAHGVTTARAMAGSPANLLVRQKVEAGELAGPRIYAAAPALNENNTATAEQARVAIRQASQAGFDLIKSHHLTDVDVWQAVQEEARRQGLPVAGHVTNPVGLERAMSAGQQVEHLDGVIAAMISAGSPEKQIEFGQIPPPPVVRAALKANDSTLNALALKVASANSWHVPTLSLFEKLVDLDAPTQRLLERPEMRYVPDAALQQWSGQREQLRAMGLTAEDGKALRDLRRTIVAAFHRAGVGLMAGSDTAQAFHVWGPALHEEIESLAASGMSPIEALRSATVTPRNYFRSLPNRGSALGWTADFGTIEAGARADLILLAEDPSHDLRALKSLQTVIAGGRVYDRKSLDALLAKAAADAKAASPAGGTSTGTANAEKQVFLMRHLQVGNGNDPGLSVRGREKAQLLPDLLSAAKLKAIFVTNTRRSRETAAPIATKLALKPNVYDPGNPDALVEAVAAVAGNVLVVGHSNTLPDLAARFGAEAFPDVGHDNYDTLWLAESRSRRLKSFSIDGPGPAALGPCATPGLHPSARCGSIWVPENRRKADGRRLRVHFAVIPAADSATDAPIVMLPGGPGLGGVQSGPGIEQMFGPMHRNRDILLIDQRGTGQSNALHCPKIDGGDPLGQLGASGKEEAVRCLAALSEKADLRHYHTREAVLDMEEVRKSLGYEQLDLFGMSYGSRVALDYLRLFPSRVGQTLVRAAAPASMTLPLWTPRDTQQSFDQLVRACQIQPDCALRHPDLDGDLKAVMARLDTGAVPVEFVNPLSGERVRTRLDQERLSTALFALLYIPDFYVQLPPLLKQARNGNLSPLVQAAAPFLLGVGDQVAWGMRWSVICDEDVRRIPRRKVRAATAGTFMGASPVLSEMEACSVWPRAAVPNDYLKPVASQKPVLILSGPFDPIAGPVWGAEIARTLPNSLHLEIPGASHLPPFPGCTAEVVSKFLDGVKLSRLETGCVSQIPRPRLKVDVSN